MIVMSKRKIFMLKDMFRSHLSDNISNVLKLIMWSKICGKNNMLTIKSVCENVNQNISSAVVTNLVYFDCFDSRLKTQLI